MKHILLKLSLSLTLFFLVLPFTGCQSSAETASVTPFSNASWEFTKDDILALEGNDYTVYDSVYGGMCYTYPKNFNDYGGTIKYMLNEEDRLMCIAWAYSAEDEEKLQSICQQIQTYVTEQNGNASQEINASTNSGSVWYREEGNIIISLMATSEMKALQYAYLHPDVSSPEK